MRPLHFKILDIKAIRSLARLLGKLEIYFYSREQELIPQYVDGVYVGDAWEPRVACGIDLKESKEYVERKYKYAPPNPYTADPNTILSQGQCIKNGPLHVIKRIRQTMFFLNKLGIQTADPGLVECKKFYDRMWKL